MRLAVAILTVAGAAAHTLQAQSPSLNPPKFEVAAIKPCKDGGSGGRNGGGDRSPGRLHITCVTAKDLIRDAYDLLADGHLPRGLISRNSRTVPIEGGPGWINSDRYEIDAKRRAHKPRKSCEDL
jgi:uncharacterized protein (TIGR03435 family)